MIRLPHSNWSCGAARAPFIETPDGCCTHCMCFADLEDALVKPTEIKGGELMRLFHITLEPLKEAVTPTAKEGSVRLLLGSD
jgi:hypothetical protein